MENTLKFKRNELGLLDSVTYKYNEDDTIDWRSIINPKYLYVNKENFLRRKETVPESIVGVRDSDLISTLGGLKELASLRGYTSVSYRPIVAGNDYAATTCRIEWIGNYETNMIPVSFEDCAGASTYNTSELIQTYLIETATNRAFARTIRNFLKINIVSREELPPPKDFNKNGSSQLNPGVILGNLMKEKGRTFDDVKEKLLNEGDKSFENYKSFNDVPGDKAFQLIDRFKVLKSKNA